MVRPTPFTKRQIIITVISNAPQRTLLLARLCAETSAAPANGVPASHPRRVFVGKGCCPGESIPNSCVSQALQSWVPQRLILAHVRHVFLKHHQLHGWRGQQSSLIHHADAALLVHA